LDPRPDPRPAERFRVPLHFKVMVSYLVVVGLVLIPTLIYLRTEVRKSLLEISQSSAPTQQIDDAVVATYRFTEKAGALGLTAAVVLSLVAALVVSRPLRRLTEAVRGFGQGDFGHPVAVDSTDELGELADALRELALRLAEQLREAGAHRAALQALVEELPLGVLMYDEAGSPLAISARARELCRLPLAEDLQSAGEWVKLPEHAAAIAQARADDRGVVVPWVLAGRVKRAAELEVRWFTVPGPPGKGRIVGIVSDREQTLRIDALEEILRDDAQLMRRAAGVTEGDLAARLETAADQAERAVLGRRATADQVETRDIGTLCSTALEEVKARAAARGVTFSLELDDPALRVVEAEGRSQQAVRRLFDAMISEAQASSEVRIESDAGPKLVRITARTPEGRRIKTKPIAEIIHCLGGDAGSKHTGEATEAW